MAAAMLLRMARKNTFGPPQQQTLPKVSIDVSDNGCGISTDAAQQLFTPFFTTKPQAQGLGLTLIREILTKHKCTYQLHTSTDKLTHFKIMF